MTDKVRGVFIPSDTRRAPYITEVKTNFEALGNVVGGYYEQHTSDLLIEFFPCEEGIMPLLIMDEEAKLKGRPFNPRASALYGQVLAGDILLVGVSYNVVDDNEEEDYRSLEPDWLEPLRQFGLDLDATV